MTDKCRYCDEQGKIREEVLNIHDEHEVLCGEHFAMVLLVQLDKCKGENSYPKAIALKNRYSYVPKREVLVIKDVSVATSKKRRRRR